MIHFSSSYRGVLVPGGFGVRGTEGKMLAINWARKQNKPFLGNVVVQFTDKLITEESHFYLLTIRCDLIITLRRKKASVKSSVTVGL